MSSNTPPPPPGRRKHERYEFLAQVQLPLQGEVHILNVVNISAGGLLLRQEAQDLPDLVLGTLVQVFLEVPESTNRPAITLEGDADVVRMQTGSGSAFATIALMWSSSDATFARTLAQVLEVAKVGNG